MTEVIKKVTGLFFQPYEPSDPFVKHPITDKVYEITYVLNGWGFKNGYVVFGIREVRK